MRVAIVGAGIGGCTLALCLHDAGFDDIVLYESAPEFRELGVGINVLPHAARELTELGLADRIDAVAVRTGELSYHNRFGQELWLEPRGIAAGYRWPQWSVHRGHLLGVLARAVLERIGEHRVHFGHRVAADTVDSVDADVVVGADGVHSALRRLVVPDEGPPLWNGVTMWRGVTVGTPFLGGRRMLMAGRLSRRIILYPLHDLPDGQQLINWVVAVRTGSDQPMPAQDWSAVATVDDALAGLEGIDLDFVDVRALIRNSDSVLVYPMADREPIDTWRNGRMTLLGDAAHPMQPNGSNGAAQAIIDARILTRELVGWEHSGTPLRALDTYEAERTASTRAVVLANRTAGPERILDVVADRSSERFDRLEEVVAPAELAEIVDAYRRTAGFDPDVLNQRDSLASRRAGA